MNHDKYTSSFWETNVSQSTGFDLLVDHIGKTLDMVNSVICILDNKIGCQDSYCKALQKMTKLNINKAEKTRVEPVILNLTELVNKEHDNVSSRRDEMRKESLDPLREAHRIVSETLRKKKGDCSKLAKDKKTNYDEAIKACKNLTAKSFAYEMFVKKFPCLDDEKVRVKAEKFASSMKHAEKEARVSVEILNQSLNDWEKGFFSFCQTTEDLVRQLWNKCGQSLKKATQIECAGCDFIKESCSELASMDYLTICEEYICKFVEEKGTNEAFSNYASLTETGTEEKKEFSLNIVVADANKKTSSSSFSRVSAHNYVNVKPVTASVNSNSENPHNNHKNYDVAVPESQSEFGPGDRVVAMFDYVAQASDELSLKKGDQLNIVFQEDDSWYMGEKDNGEKGIFPISYISRK